MVTYTLHWTVEIAIANLLFARTSPKYVRSLKILHFTNGLRGIDHEKITFVLASPRIKMYM